MLEQLQSAGWKGTGPNVRTEDGALVATVSTGPFVGEDLTPDERDRLAKRIAREHNAIALIGQLAPRNDDATFRQAVQDILTEYRLNWQAGQGNS